MSVIDFEKHMLDKVRRAAEGVIQTLDDIDDSGTPQDPTLGNDTQSDWDGGFECGVESSILVVEVSRSDGLIGLAASRNMIKTLQGLK